MLAQAEPGRCRASSAGAELVWKCGHVIWKSPPLALLVPWDFLQFPFYHVNLKRSNSKKRTQRAYVMNQTPCMHFNCPFGQCLGQTRDFKQWGFAGGSGGGGGGGGAGCFISAASFVFQGLFFQNNTGLSKWVLMNAAPPCNKWDSLMQRRTFQKVCR